MKNPLEQDILLSRLEEFNSLETICEKLDYWCRFLPVNYIQYSVEEGQDKYPHLNEFRINLTSPNEREEFALWIIKNYSKYQDENSRFRQLDFEGLKAQIELDVKTSPEIKDKKRKVQLELKKVDNSFKPMSGILPNRINLPTTFINFEFNADHGAFTEYLEYGIEPDFSKTFDLSTRNIIQVWNGYTLAKYREYLSEKLETLNEQPSVEMKDISLDQRLLLLRYLGALELVMEANNNTKQGKLLGQLMRTDPESIRQRFSSINDLIAPKDKVKRRKLVSDMEEIQHLFEELGLEKIVKKVKADLRKLKLDATSNKL